MTVLDFISAGGGLAAIVALGAFLSKRGLDHLLKSEVERLKNELAAVASKELAILQARLRQSETEHKIRFGDLHDRRGRIIAKVYRLIFDMYIALRDYTKCVEHASDLPLQVRRGKAVETLRSVEGYFPPRRIFFSKATQATIDTLLAEGVEAIKKFGDLLAAEAAGRTDANAYDDALRRTETQIKPALSALEDEFRRLLGVEVSL